MSERFEWLEVERQAGSDRREAAESFDARAYLQEAERGFRRGNYEVSLKLYGQALGEDAGRWEAWLGQVLCLLELGELAEARIWANKALERFPGRSELLAAKALVLARQGEPAPAMEHADLAMQKKDAVSVIWLLRGLVLLRVEHEQDGAARCFRKAFEAGDPDGWLSLRAGMGYLDAGEPARARECLERSVERDGQNPLAWFVLGRAFEGLFALGRALACNERAYALKPEFKPKVVDAIRRLRDRSLWNRAVGRLRAWLGGV